MHAYPENLAALVRREWDKPPQAESLIDLPRYDTADRLPRPAVLKLLVSICYQASLLREEDRTVRFRLILRDPERFTGVSMPSGALFVLPFAQPIPVVPNELRRLAGAAAFERSLIGTRVGARGCLEIWGIVHSGEHWLRALEGSRRSFQPLPPSLVISVGGPGQLTLGKGSVTLARLVGGRLATPVPSILEIADGGPAAAELDRLMLNELEREHRRAGGTSLPVAMPVLGLIRRQVALRVVSAMRRTQHGSTLLLLPPSLARRPRNYTRVLQIKYAFSRGKARHQLRRLVVQLLVALAQDCAARFGPRHQATWKDYLNSTHPEVRQADEAIHELARQIACFSAVDGAVVIGQPLELLGFGAEISGYLPKVEYVARALDPQISRIEIESVFGVGTRHRSAYRFCNALPGASALVVSHDGSVRLIGKRGDYVVYSEHLSSGALNV